MYTHLLRRILRNVFRADDADLALAKELNPLFVVRHGW